MTKQVRIPDDLHETVLTAAQRRGVGPQQYVAHCIRMDRYWSRHVTRGARPALIEPDGTVREVLIPD